MVWSWLRRFLGKGGGKHDPSAWQRAVDSLPFYALLEQDEEARLLDLAQQFERDKWWEGCGGLVLTETMRASVSLQACLLILNLDHRFYARVRTILVYPTAYVAEHGTPGRAGEAWLRGPVVLSWDDAHAGGRRADDGRNTVLHEFAHKLDMLDDDADGMPPLAASAVEVWRRIVGDEYERHVRRASNGRATLLDHYGATNPAEFFAVATECFFEQARKLRSRHSELYGLLSDFYRQHPASRTSPVRSIGRRRGRI